MQGWQSFQIFQEPIPVDDVTVRRKSAVGDAWTCAVSCSGLKHVTYPDKVNNMCSPPTPPKFYPLFSESESAPSPPANLRVTYSSCRPEIGIASSSVCRHRRPAQVIVVDCSVGYPLSCVSSSKLLCFSDNRLSLFAGAEGMQAPRARTYAG